MVTIDYTISIGTMIEVAVIGIGIASAFAALRTSVTGLTGTVKIMQAEIQKLSEVVTHVAVQKERMDGLSDRLNRLDMRYDELRHGHGFVQGSHGIEREYPTR